MAIVEGKGIKALLLARDNNSGGGGLSTGGSSLSIRSYQLASNPTIESNVYTPVEFQTVTISINPLDGLLVDDLRTSVRRNYTINIDPDSGYAISNEIQNQSFDVVWSLTNNYTVSITWDDGLNESMISNILNIEVTP